MSVASRDTAGLVRRLVSTGRGDAALRLAAEALRAGKHREAEELARAALDAGLHEPGAYYVLAGAARATGRLALAADMAGVGIALDPEPDGPRRDLATILLELGRPAEAASLLEAIPPGRRDRACRERLGLAYALGGRRGQARGIFRALLAEHPEDDRARAALARLAPRGVESVLDEIARGLDGPLGVIFRRLRVGPASERDLAEVLCASGHRNVLLLALIRELADRTRPGAVPLVRVAADRIDLDLTVLDVETRGAPR